MAAIARQGSSAFATPGASPAGPQEAPGASPTRESFSMEMPRIRRKVVANHMAKALFSEATKVAIQNLTQRPSDFTIEMYVRLPVYGMDDQ